jgi:hypothetical protein
MSRIRICIKVKRQKAKQPRRLILELRKPTIEHWKLTQESVRICIKERGMIRIRIRIKIKGRIRIRINVKSRIRILIKVKSRIRNTGLVTLSHETCDEIKPKKILSLVLISLGAAGSFLEFEARSRYRQLRLFRHGA